MHLYYSSSSCICVFLICIIILFADKIYSKLKIFNKIKKINFDITQNIVLYDIKIRIHSLINVQNIQKKILSFYCSAYCFR